jgi:mannitol-specific phosphotransferase system IIBC component
LKCRIFRQVRSAISSFDDVDDASPSKIFATHLYLSKTEIIMIINFFTLNFAATSCYINDSNSDTNLLQQNIFKIKKKKKKKKRKEKKRKKKKSQIQINQYNKTPKFT